jgi:hypothetical protein
MYKYAGYSTELLRSMTVQTVVLKSFNDCMNTNIIVFIPNYPSGLIRMSYCSILYFHIEARQWLDSIRNRQLPDLHSVMYSAFGRAISSLNSP